MVLAGSSSSFSSVINTIQAPLTVGGYTDYGLINGFSLSVPGGETIVGVKLTIECYSLTAFPEFSIDHSVRLWKGTVVGSDHASAVAWTGSPNFRIYGSSSDTWIAGLTPADVNSPAFGILVSGQLSGTIPGTAIIQKLTTVVEITTTLGGGIKPPTPPGGGVSFINANWRTIPGDGRKDF